MTQKEIISYYEENGGLRCKDWSISEIKKYVKAELGEKQRVYESTCDELKSSARMNQR